MPSGWRRYIPPWFTSPLDLTGFVVGIVASLIFSRGLYWQNLCTTLVTIYAAYWTIWWLQSGGGDWHKPGEFPPDPDGPDGEALRRRLIMYRRSIFKPRQPVS